MKLIRFLFMFLSTMGYVNFDSGMVLERLGKEGDIFVDEINQIFVYVFEYHGVC